MFIEYEIWIWEDMGLTLHLETEDFDKVVDKCKRLSSIGIEYEVHKKTTELLDI